MNYTNDILNKNVYLSKSLSKQIFLLDEGLGLKSRRLLIT